MHTGIILKTGRFSDCVRFCRDLPGLPVRFKKDGPICLRSGSGHLMLETGGLAGTAEQTVAAAPSVPRFHVPDLAVAAESLRRAGLPVGKLRFDRCPVGACVVPDGTPRKLAEAWDDAAAGRDESRLSRSCRFAPHCRIPPDECAA